MGVVKNLLGREVLRAQFHVGFADTARTGCHAEKDKAHMELTPAGVYVKTHKSDEYIVPYSNVTWCHLKAETVSADLPSEPEEAPRRGPGRPPKAAS